METPKKLKVKVIGVGGIGGCLLPVLCRLLNYGSSMYSFDEVDIGLIDGDQYEERNRDRQAFRDRGNKAEINLTSLEEDFPNLFFRAHPTYITEENIGMLIKDGDVVFLCVDNHKTRRLVSRYCEDELQNVVLLSGGNDLTDGSLQVFIRKDGWNQTLPLDSQFHPEIADPQDEHPDEVEEREGCLEEQVSAPQLLVANNMAAATMLNAFHGWLTGVFSGPFRYDEAFFDLGTNKVRAVSRQEKEQ
jgi:molybdopterin/thiamine biosynthesis adenylyltransferase